MPALLLEVAVRAALIALGTACILGALRIRTAAVRHAAWTTVLIAMLLLPIWAVAGPKVPLAVLPAPAVSLDLRDPGSLAPLPSPTEPRPVPIEDTASSGTASGPGMWMLIGAYLLGAVALLVRLGIGTVQAHGLRREAVIHAGRVTSGRCATPITVGWLSPVLILPEGWHRWSTAQLDAVLTHEQEHARRRDPLVQWLALLNRAIFWFHPLAWWLERRLANLAEEACDAAVIRAGHSPQDYSDYLIDMAHALRRQGRRLNVAGMAMPGSGLPNRMRHIFEEGLMTPTPRTRVVSTLAFCTASSVIFAAGILAPRPSVTASYAPAAASGKPDIVVPRQTPAERADRAHADATILAQPAPLSTRRIRGGWSPTTADFSGNWVLVSSTYAGRGRGGAGGDGVREVKVSIASGAPVNCGTGCSIEQNRRALTITRPDQPGTIPPDIGVVVLNLDGSESAITQSNGGEFSATATWDGGKLVVTRETAYSSVTQTLSLEEGKLIVATRFSAADAPVTLTYVKR